MKTVVIGGGEIGRAIADAMVKEDNEVYIIEFNEARANELQSAMDVQLVQGSGCNPKTLKAARIKDADLIAVVTDRDEDNLCAATLARYFAPRAKIIARIRNPELAAEKDFLVYGGPRLTHILNPEILAARQIFHSIRIPSAVEVMEFEGGRLFLIGVKIPPSSPLAGITMKELPKMLRGQSVLFVARYRQDSLIIPKGNTGIKPDDLLYFISRAEDVRSTATAIGLKWKEVKNVLIVGATVTGLHLAKLMRESGISVKLVERDHKRATTATESLPGALVFNAEPTDYALWEEENLAEADALASVCRDEEMNLLVALMGKKMGVKHTAVITYNSAFIPILLESGITTVVSPRSAAISTVLQFLRRGRVLQVSEIEHEDAELLEFETREGDKIAGKTVQEIEFPKGAIIGAIFKNDTVIIPSGETQIEGGDKILIFARKKAIPDVEILMLAHQG